MKLFTQGVQKADIRRISGRTDLPGQRFSIDQDNSHFEKHDMFKFLIAIESIFKRSTRSGGKTRCPFAGYPPAGWVKLFGQWIFPPVVQNTKYIQDL